MNKYSNASSIITWGGEDNDPPDFGKVYIAIKPVTGLTLTAVAKNDVQTILKKYKVLSIVPVVVDPDYTFITTDTTVSYNSSIALNTEDTIKNGAIDYLAKPADADDVENALLALPESKAVPPKNPMSADRVKWEHIHRVFELCNRNVSETARRLKMHRRTLQRILSKRSPK